jgi:glycine dehydrogenase subunit 1
MPFIPHTDDDVKRMLAAIGADSVDDLFDEIPAELRGASLANIPEGLNEQAITRLMQQRAREDAGSVCFIGAGAYDHHIPAAVWELTTRGEFYSAYTPYQAEASQGTLQLIYEYQSMMTALTGMDASNASLYDGASALAEAVLMAVRAHRKSKSKKILLPRTVHPYYRKTTHAIVHNQGITLEELDYDRKGGHIDPTTLPDDPGDVTALVIPCPNFFGVLEEVDALTDWAHQHNMLVIAVVNPLSLSLLKPPGQWGKDGADIVCGEGQPLGVPLSSGGPYYGLMCCKQALVRQMPGRIVGRTEDLDGKPGYALTLQAREQHIRRSKATSNICTNQGLMVTASTIHMALMGAEGLKRTALQCHQNTRRLLEKLSAIDGVEPLFDRAFFHEVPLRLALPAQDVLRILAEHNILGGFDLSQDYPELGEALLVCATEQRSEEEMDQYVEQLQHVYDMQLKAGTPVQPKMA